MTDYNDDISINASMDNIGRAMFGNAPMSDNPQVLLKEMKELKKAYDNGTITEKQRIKMLQIQEILNKKFSGNFGLQ